MRIGMATEFVCMDLAPAILKFRDDNPSMMVEVLPVPAGIAPDCLRDSKVDIVFIFTDRTRFSSDFDSRVVKKIPLHWVVNKRNPLAQKEFLCPEDLLGQKIIILETTAGMHEIGTYGAPLRILNQKSGLRLHETKIAQTTQESLVAVACDEGICMLTSSLAHLVPQNCVMLPIDGVDFSLTALWMKRIDSKSIKSFLEYAEVELIR